MALKDKRAEIYGYIQDHQEFIKHNKKLFDIYQGNLLPYVQHVLSSSLTPEYYTKMEHRIVPINVLTRVMDKLAKVYATTPMRIASSDEEILKQYEDLFFFDAKMNRADEYANLFKGYALEPFIDEGVPGLRVLPYDRFLVKTLNPVNPEEVNVFIKFMGKKSVKGSKCEEEREVFFVYTDDEFDAFDEELEDFAPALMENEGENPVGRIPFMYGNRSKDGLIPVTDTDIMQMVLIIAVLLSDLGGSVLFSCFSIVFGIDVNFENITKSPNAFWSLKSDPKSDKTPELGTIKSDADVDKVLRYIKDIFILWLETKGVKVGSVGEINNSNMASGVAKIVDQMDTFEIRKVSIQHFKAEEKEFWDLMRDMHNHWIDSGQLSEVGKLPDDWEVTTIFDEPKPLIDRMTYVNTIKLEVDSGFLDRKSAIKALYPDLGESDLDERLKAIDDDQTVNIGVTDDQEGRQGDIE